MYRGINLILQELHKSWEIFSACGAVDQQGGPCQWVFTVATHSSFLCFFFFSVKVRKFTSSRSSWRTLTAQSLPNSLFLACLLSTVVLKDFFYFLLFTFWERHRWSVDAVTPELLLVASNKQNSGFICEDLLLKKKIKKCLRTTSTNVVTEM